jgi:hypothetical protein
MKKQYIVKEKRNFWGNKEYEVTEKEEDISSAIVFLLIIGLFLSTFLFYEFLLLRFFYITNNFIPISNIKEKSKKYSVYLFLFLFFGLFISIFFEPIQENKMFYIWLRFTGVSFLLGLITFVITKLYSFFSKND